MFSFSKYFNNITLSLINFFIRIILLLIPLLCALFNKNFDMQNGDVIILIIILQVYYIINKIYLSQIFDDIPIIIIGILIYLFSYKDSVKGDAYITIILLFICYRLIGFAESKKCVKIDNDIDVANDADNDSCNIKRYVENTKTILGMSRPTVKHIIIFMMIIGIILLSMINLIKGDDSAEYYLMVSMMIFITYYIDFMKTDTCEDTNYYGNCDDTEINEITEFILLIFRILMVYLVYHNTNHFKQFIENIINDGSNLNLSENDIDPIFHIILCIYFIINLFNNTNLFLSLVLVIQVITILQIIKFKQDS